MDRRRIDEVRIALRGGIVVIPSTSRDALLERLQLVETMGDIRDAFRAVGTTQPVLLTGPAEGRADERHHVLGGRDGRRL